MRRVSCGEGESDVIGEMQKHRENRKKMQEDADDVFEKAEKRLKWPRAYGFSVLFKALKQQLEWLQKKKGADIKARCLFLRLLPLRRRNCLKNGGSGSWTTARRCFLCDFSALWCRTL